jgi:urease accessory protein
MLRAIAVVRRSDLEPGLIADHLTLAHDQRHRRRMAMTADGGLSFLLDLERATMLDDGDALRLEDGRLVQVKAAPERLVEITAATALGLKKIIWHLGNRHVPAEITDDAVYIAEDHVLVDMARGLGATATPIERAFRPERGAYDGGGGHGHAHHHDGHHHHGHAHHHE